MVQCKSMGIWDKWEEVLDMYRDVNQLFGDIVKVQNSVNSWAQKDVGNSGYMHARRRELCVSLVLWLVLHFLHACSSAAVWWIT